MKKTKRIAKFDGLEPQRCKDVKGIVAPEIGPKSFGTFEKQAPGWSSRSSFLFFVLQENEDSGNRRPIMLETASSRDGPVNSRRGETESSVASGGVVGEKRRGENTNSQSSSQDRSSKNVKKDKQDSNASGEFKRYTMSLFFRVKSRDSFVLGCMAQ